MLLIIAGAALVAVALADVFGTALNYDGFGFLSSRGQRLGWVSMRGAARLAPDRLRQGILSLAGPTLLPLSVAVWALTTLVGFSLIYYDGIRSGDVTLAVGLDPSYGEALYMSGVTLTTLGYGDATPTAPTYQVAAVLEGLVGFAIITLVISYLSSTFRVLAALSNLSDTLRASDADRRQPITALQRYFRQGSATGLSSFLQQVRTQVSDFRGSLRRYPVAYYFHPRDATRSLPFAVATIADMVAGLRFGTDDPCTSRNPWLLDLEDELEQLMDLVADRFLPGDTSEVGPAETGTVPSLADVPAAVARFREVERYIAGLLGREPPGDLDRARFAEWHAAAVRRDTIVTAVARDLGYEDDELPAAQVGDGSAGS